MPASKRSGKEEDRSDTSASEPKLLAGGNPQIPKGDGDGPVQDYIAAMPGWKEGVGATLDELIVKSVPDVHKAVRWNQPLYGAGDERWYFSFRCFTKYVQLSFFQGSALDPPPPKTFKQPEVRALMIHEDDELDAALLTLWIEQASRLPGGKL